MRSRTETVYFLTLLLLISTLGGVYTPEKQVDELEENEIRLNSITRSSNLIDIPSWKINDRWNYNGHLDMVDFIADSGVNTDLQTLTGTLENTVTDIYLTNIDNISSLVYKVEADGYYEANDINLDGNSGDLEVTMSTVSIIRASDLATASQEATIDINFCANVLWWCVDVSIGTLEVDQSYSPPLEGYDFPLSVGESWSQNYTATTNYAGSSDYVDIPENTISQRNANYEVVSQGFSGVGYGGCAISYNISSTNGDGEDTGYKWFCPAIRGDIKMETIESLGFTAVHSLSSYQASSRQKIINVDVEFPLSPINIETSAWINITNNNGNPVGNQQVEFRYEVDGEIQSLTTAANGSVHTIFNTRDNADNSYSGDDLGSHGILAWISTEDIIGASTVTIDPNVFEIDLYANQDGVSVERTRGNSTITLDNNIGFTAIRDDLMTFSIPVINRGIILSPPAILQITGPDGTVTDANIPSLSSLEEARVEVSWRVPSNQPFGNIAISFNIDIDDGDLTNNEGEFTLFIGEKPVALLTIVEESLTLDEVILNGLNSYDPDGGIFYCTFSLESLTGSILVSEEEDCIFEYTWNDDGVFTVSMVITDEENDFHSVSSEITIINRAPEITLSVDSDTSPVLTPITFEIIDRTDLDTLNPEAPVDILWKAPCDQGSLGIKCTLTPTEEGEYTIEVEATDDDGAVTVESYTIEVTNIAPYNPEWEVQFEGNRIIPNSYGLYTVEEGDQLRIIGWAEDSDNDMSSLQYVWAPDAEDEPDTKIFSKTIEYIYNTEGQHIATFQVFDDNNASTNLMTIPFKVNNIAPTIRPFSQPLPVAEDQTVEITIIVDDTIYDIESLVPCYDIEPDTNSDSIGNASDDCDIESYHLEYAWPNSDTAPNHVVFHVTDNDGAIASADIPIDVRNMKPNIGMTTSSYQPVEGEAIILTGNGTTDSFYDMTNMQYWWDMDISKDSDNDGDASNDMDITGKIVEWSFATGDKVIQLTVYDGESSDTMRITIQVQEKPFALTDILFNPIFIVLILLVTVGMLGVLMRKKKIDSVEEYQGNLRRHKTKVSMNDAFDDPEYDPFSDEKQKQKISKKRIKQEKNKPASENSENIDGDLSVNQMDDKINQEMDELRAKLKELEDKNLSANEVMSVSEIEELIGEEE